MAEHLTPLAGRARWLFHLQGLWRLVALAPVLLGGTVTALIFGVPWMWTVGLGLAAGLVLTLWSLWMPSLAYDRWGYAVTDEELLIQHGVLFRELTAIPITRVQHVDTHQGPLEQLFGLARVHVYTASGMGADGIIPGLEPEVADALRDRLIKAGGDDGV